MNVPATSYASIKRCVARVFSLMEQEDLVSHLLRPLPYSVLVLLLLLTAANSAPAQSCTLSATNVNFGTYTGTAVSPGASTILVTCPSGVVYQVLLNAGQGSGASETVRNMTGGAYTLSYGLYQDSSHSNNWGNTTATGYQQGTGTGSAQAFYVFPQLTAGQKVAPGTYTDTITVTLGGASGTTTFTVTATVVANCTVSTSALTFGNYSPTTPTNGTATVSITCTNNTTFNVGLNSGTGSGSTGTTRFMTGPSAALLQYHIYSDSARTSEWGNTVGTNTVAGTGTGSAQTRTAYGEIKANHPVNPGSYSDTITATITY